MRIKNEKEIRILRGYKLDDEIIARLFSPGVIGFYNCVEIIEIFWVKTPTEVVNVLTLAVAEESELPNIGITQYLNDKPMRLKSLRGTVFGIKKYRVSVEVFQEKINEFNEGQSWGISGEILRNRCLRPPIWHFVPSDNADRVPFNSILKNNFWSGSHVAEWVDEGKEELDGLFQKPESIQELSEIVQSYLPISIASLSDRLGNIVLQFPVTLLIARQWRGKEEEATTLKVDWHPKATPRDLEIIYQKDFDEAVNGFSKGALKDGAFTLPDTSGGGLSSTIIWDEAEKLLISATGKESYVGSISINIGIGNPEPRVFSIPIGNGEYANERISVVESGRQTIVGAPYNPNGGLTNKRMYKDELAKLTKSRKFVQYKPVKGDAEAGRKKALADLRALIDAHGEFGAWLWDPYISAVDILQTLFYCRHFGSDLRALGSAKESKSQSDRPSKRRKVESQRIIPFRKELNIKREKDGYIERQRRELDFCRSNWHGLSLEYRVKRGMAGWGFHDRFLIFPDQENGAMAWSLGTSVNSFGEEHHILQKVDDGQLIMDAFLELWNQLDSPEYVVWKK